MSREEGFFSSTWTNSSEFISMIIDAFDGTFS
jgi:hypothetical protein